MRKETLDEEEEEREAVGGGGREGDEEVIAGGLEEGEEDDDEDGFFESLDRVPSGVSFGLDVPSSCSDGEDDVRFSFASAIAPPSEPRRASTSDEYDDEGGQGYDYGIWMAEPISIEERRHRLLQGMGFTSSKGMDVEAAAGERSRCSLELSRSLQSRHRIAAAASAAPPSLSSRQPILSRSISDTQIVMRGPDFSPRRRRASSAPSSPLWEPSGYQSRAPGEGGGDRGGAAGGDRGGVDPSPTTGGGGVCRIKNLDTGKEFVVSEVGNRLNDLQTGLQLTLEEFERFLGYSPIVKELMRRVNLGSSGDKKGDSPLLVGAAAKRSSSKSSRGRKGGWLKNIKFVASSVTGLISEKDRDGGGAMMAPGAGGGREWLKVHQHGKSHKELTGLYMCQQIEAHRGSIWCIKFSPDSRYLASAGEDRVVHVWQVLLDPDSTASSSSSSYLPTHNHSSSSLPPLLLPNGSAACLSAPPSKRTRKGKVSSASRRSTVPDHIVMPDTIFSLAEKPVCLFEGHLDDVLDLSWSKSQYLLSSSMDKTVRLWDMESKSCLKLFAHNDYVTCIQFNPIDDRYFISGSLDAKVRIWSIPDRQVVDWSDLHEMVTAVCYTPDGQGALVGSHKGSCRFYNISDCKLNQESQIDIRNKKSHAKKITGFQFAPANPSQVLITSADSQIRVFDGVGMIHKFRGFRNTSSQISASFTSDGRFVVCASEDSHVYVWKQRDVGGERGRGLITTRSNEHFYCKDVSVAIPWPGRGSSNKPPPLPSMSVSGRHNHSDSQRSTSTLEDIFPSSRAPPPRKKKIRSPVERIPQELRNPSQQQQRSRRSGIVSSRSFVSSSSPSLRSDASAATTSASSSSSWGWYSGGGSSRRLEAAAANAWGLVVVTAGLGGDIKIYQNFGLPLGLGGRQTNLF